MPTKDKLSPDERAELEELRAYRREVGPRLDQLEQHVDGLAQHVDGFGGELGRVQGEVKRARRRLRVDVGALSASLFDDVSRALAEVVTLTDDFLREDGRELNQLQKGELVHRAISAGSGLERTFLRDIRRTLRDDGVETWGEDRADRE